MSRLVKRVSFRLNKAWNGDENALPWTLVINHNDGIVEEKLAGQITGYGLCYGSTLTLADGRTTMAIAVDQCHLDWNGSDAIISSDAEVLVDATRNSNSLVMVRLFTPWLKDQTLPPWRILEVTEPDEFEEKPARAFEMVGDWFGRRHNFPDPTGRKMHVACFGSVVWAGDRAFISSWS